MIRGRSASFWLALALLELYPRSYRARYGEELRAVLEDCRITAGTLFDLLLGALDAHLRPGSLVASSCERMRGTVFASLMLWIALVLVGSGFAKTTEDFPFRAAETAHPLLGDTRIAVAVLAITGAAVVLLAGAPLAIAIIRQAWDGRSRALRRAVVAPLVALGCFAIATGALVLIARQTHGNGALLARLAFTFWIAFTVVVAGVCAVGARAALEGARLHRATLTVAAAGAWLLARVMAAVTVATALYAVLLAVYAGGLGDLSNGPLRVPTSVSLALEVATMLVITALALVTARRGWRPAPARE